MALRVTEERITGDQVDLSKLVERSDKKIREAVKSLAEQGDFEWKGETFSSRTIGSIVCEAGSMFITRGVGDGTRSWLAADEGEKVQIYRVVYPDDVSGTLLVELPGASNASLEDKYERNAIEDVLEGCQKESSSTDEWLHF